jgi:aspartate carbamoyltransferase
MDEKKGMTCQAVVLPVKGGSMYQAPVRVQSAVETIQGNFKGKDIVSFDQFAVEDLAILFDVTQRMKHIAQNNEPSRLLEGLLVTLLFFEPSSRTFSSFAAAVKRLGGQTIEMQNPEQASSINKGETFEDTIRVIEAYSNLLVMRHRIPGAAREAALAAEFMPVINAGDGNNEHPTQTLLDMFTLYERFGRLDNLTGLLAGDALNSRAIHSLIRGLSLYPNNTLYVLAPQRLRLTRDDVVSFRDRGVRLIEIQRAEDIPQECDFWYWTRVQKERFDSPEEYQNAQYEIVVATPELLNTYAKKDMILMDPLPRVGSVDPAVDADERAVYLRSQIRNGLYTRMALLALVLGRV